MREEERRGERLPLWWSGRMISWEIGGHFVQDGLATAVATTSSSLSSVWTLDWIRLATYVLGLLTELFSREKCMSSLCVRVFVFAGVHTNRDSEKRWLSQRCCGVHTSHLPNEINHNLELELWFFDSGACSAPSGARRQRTVKMVSL